MLEQFVNSIFAYFTKVEPMNAYVQKVPVDVEYPCYLLNKCDITTDALNSYFFMNHIHLYIRIFGTDEIKLKNQASNLTQELFKNQRKIPILEEDGTESSRFIRIEDVESIEINVDENEMYCVELNFSFDTTHNVDVQEFDLLEKVSLI